MQTPQERYDLLSREVYQAARQMAPHGWISDYIECIGEVPFTDRDGSHPQIQTFPEYLREQLDFQEEDGDVNPPEYYEALQGYLDEFHPDYCTYCHTFGHISTACPDTPMTPMTANLYVPAGMTRESIAVYLREGGFMRDGGELLSIDEEEDDDAA